MTKISIIIFLLCLLQTVFLYIATTPSTQVRFLGIKCYGLKCYEDTWRSDHRPILTVVVLTYSKPNALRNLLRSVVDQRLSLYWMEILVVDNGCKVETKNVFELFSFEEKYLYSHHAHYHLKYIPLCNNQGYAVGNNEGLALGGSPSAKYILFLNDDIILSTHDFIENMVVLAEKKRDATAVGCKIVNMAGSELQEAGSIIFKDGSAMGFGRGARFDDIFSSEYSYPRPVDYVSGACLLIERRTFVGYKHESHKPGFDSVTFRNYYMYEDTDLQLHIQHDLHKEVWLQPKSIAKHKEHGTFGAEASVKLMQDARRTLYTKWKDKLERHHQLHPSLKFSEKEEITKHLLFASDVRARNAATSIILYIDERVPNSFEGAGFGRAFDNLSMLAELGQKVTVLTRSIEKNDDIVERITDLGIEYYKGDINQLVSERFGLYDIVLISRPTTFQFFRDELRKMYFKCPFTLIYDSEALAFRRDELRLQIGAANGITFPEKNVLSDNDLKLLIKDNRSREVSLLASADIVVTVSDQESRAVSEVVPRLKENLYTVGHVIDFTSEKKNGFENRFGILFVGAFHGVMYYNGDAMWYFVTAIYPLVVQGAGTPIPLTIAGRKIPQELREAVAKDQIISPHVTFLESPLSLDDLMDNCRVFIAPHLYGAGIQYKVSVCPLTDFAHLSSYFLKFSI